MSWEEHIQDFCSHLKLERGLSENTIKSYRSDIEGFYKYLIENNPISTPADVCAKDIENYLKQSVDNGIKKRSQARKISSLKSFYKFINMSSSVSAENTDNPCSTIESPKMSRYLPNVLSVEEIDKIIGSIDLTSDLGYRNKAIIEMLYSCGLRVSELIEIKLSDLFFKEGFIRIIGKGNKQRLVPVNDIVIEAVNNYLPIRWDTLQAARSNRGKHNSSKEISGSWSETTINGVRAFVTDIPVENDSDYFHWCGCLHLSSG